VDWAELRREFVTQLQSVGLEANAARTLKRAGKAAQGAASSAGESVLREFFKALVERIFRP
jgi:hypothetical protein